MSNSRKKTKIGINGLGRIGRTLLREWTNRHIQNFEIVAINNPGAMEGYVHLIKYDSLHKTFNAQISMQDSVLSVNNHKIQFFDFKDPNEIPWEKCQVDIVIDATGKFKTGPELSAHKRGTVKKVVMCAPGKNLDATFVYGINHQSYDKNKHHIVSNASCTTNCLAPIAQILHNTFGIEKGFMTTVHAYTSDQVLLDGSHSDLRRGRAAALSMIPTTTGAAKAVGSVIPELKGKLDGYSIRVPTPDVSVVDFTVELKKPATKETINQSVKAASEGWLKDIVAYSDEPLVSIDYLGRRESSIFDAELTNVIGNMAKVVSWYDNEVGFSNRVLDLVGYMGDQF